MIVNGREGLEHLFLTVQAWYQALGIIYPFVAILLAVGFFVRALASVAATGYKKMN